MVKQILPDGAKVGEEQSKRRRGRYRDVRGTAKTMERAMRCAFLTTDPFVVRYADGSFHWFPHFYAVPVGAEVVARYVEGAWVREGSE
jgi:hypothetical protein